MEDATSLGAGSGDEVPGVEGPEVVGPQETGASALVQESQRSRSVDWFPRIASPTSGASRSRFLMILGVNCSCAKLKICPLSGAGARTK